MVTYMYEMTRVRKGMPVSDINNRLVGHVEAVRKDAFELTPEDDSDPLWLTEDALFSVADGRITLLCAASGVDRYALYFETSHRRR